MNNCVICFNEINKNDCCITNCNHIYCNGCILNWFKQGKTSCPVCRADVENFVNNGSLNHIIKVKAENNINLNLQENFRRVYKENVYLRMIVFINFVFSLYTLYNGFIDQDNYNYYKNLYENCTDSNADLEDKLSNHESYDHESYNNNGLYGLFSQYSPEYVRKCFYPLTYINHCLL